MMLRNASLAALAAVSVALVGGPAVSRADEDASAEKPAEKSAPAERNPRAERLRDAGIEPTAAGISGYLRSLLPSEENRRLVSKLIGDLGHSRYMVREEAMRQLASLPNPPLEQLRAARRSDDFEVAYRARRLLANAARGEHTSILLATLGIIEDEAIPGFAPLLIQLIPRWEGEFVLSAARRALIATAGPDDVDLLRQAAEVCAPPARVAAIYALAELEGEEAADELLVLLEARPDRVRLAAAEALANLGRRECLAPLVELLDAQEIDVRVHARRVLGSLTGQKFGFVAYGNPQQHQQAVQAWKAWVAANGETAELEFPLHKAPQEIGHTLICVHRDKQLVEIDARGRKVLEIGDFNYIWGCHALPDGRRLAVDYKLQRVREYDAAGSVVWERDKLPGRPTSVERLDNGNTLVALSSANLVVEIAPGGRIVWQQALAGLPTTAQRLDNGNTLVNLQSAQKVVEVDPKGEVVWELKGLDRAHTAQRLANGNVLVCEMNQGKVVEYNRLGEKVWTYEGLSNPAQAQRLANGNTLVADNAGLHEIDPTGQRVWHYSVPRCRFWRF